MFSLDKMMISASSQKDWSLIETQFTGTSLSTINCVCQLGNFDWSRGLKLSGMLQGQQHLLQKG